MSWFSAFCLGMVTEYKDVRIRGHDFRHTYCTMLYDAGIDLKTAQAWMEHADEKMILKVYAHLTEQHLAEATAKLCGSLAM